MDYVYDGLGRLDQKIYDDPQIGSAPEEIVDYVYDVLGRQTKVIQDFDGDLQTTTDQRVTDYAYDEFGRLEQVASDEGVVNYEYDDATGQLLRTWTGDLPFDDAGVTTRTDYDYDRLGRLTEVDAVKQNGATGGVTSYEYDLVGNLEYVLGPVHGSFYEYDELNRLVELTQFHDSNTNDEYDDGTDERIATFTYELLSDGQRSGVIEKFYDDSGALEYATVFAWTYDNAGRLIEERLDAPGTESDYITSYAFDLVGNRLFKQTDTDPAFSSGDNSTLTPDDLRDETPAYDETLAYSYDDNDRLLVETLHDGDSTNDPVLTQTLYEYGSEADPLAGDGGDATTQTKKTLYNGLASSGDIQSETQSSYNVRGRLSGVVIEEYDSGVVVVRKTSSFAYDDGGMRVTLGEKTEIDDDQDPGTPLVTTIDKTTRHLIDHQNHTGYAQVLEEIDAQTGDLERSYVLGHDVLAQWDAVHGLAWLVYDGRGSARMLLDSAGDLLVPGGGSAQRFLYDAYGVMLSAGGVFALRDAAVTSLLYSGEQIDGLTGLSYNRARYYDLATGRFNRPDPILGNFADPQSLHKYLYTHANPLLGTDPSGLFLLKHGIKRLIQAVGMDLGIRILIGIRATYVLGEAYRREVNIGGEIAVNRQIGRLGDGDLPAGEWEAAFRNRPDIVDHSPGFHTVYEVKAVALASAARLQVDRYIDILNRRFPGKSYRPGDWQPRGNPYIITWLPGVIGLPPITIRATNVGHGVIAYSTDLSPEVIALFVQATVEVTNLLAAHGVSKVARSQLQPAFATMLGVMGGII